MTMETIIFLLNHMLTYCITVDLGNIGKINRNYPVTREVTDQGAQLVISVVPHNAFLVCLVLRSHTGTTKIDLNSK